MKSQARAVVIGGGVVGVSSLYHLARKKLANGDYWGDCVLIERKELTSGSTWHAAGLLPLFNMSYSVGQIHKYSLKFYEELQEETGQNVGLSRCSNIRLAQTKERMDEYYQYASVAETIGVNVKFLSPEEVKEIWPLVNIEGLVGAMQHTEDGYIQPADLTQALAIGARAHGAEIYRNTAVNAINRNAAGDWVVTTDKGEITCEHLITATGNFVKKTGEMLGLNLPVMPVEHQYIVTDSHPDIMKRKEQGLPEMGVLRDSDNQWYMREERGGLLLGPYEKGAPACYVDGPDKDSEYELFQEDLERLEPHIEGAIFRVPAFGEVGIKKTYNGAICYTPDGSPIIGPAWDKRNLWLNEGHSFGITAAGGAGWQLAEWIVEGEPTIDMLGVDPRRFGDFCTTSYLKTKNEEAYAHVFINHFPDEERPAGRPLRTTPCYDRMKALGAVFGEKYGWERPNWFAPEGVPQEDDWSFRRSNWFEHAVNEAKNVATNVGLLDMSAFSKCRISGPGATEFLDYMLANKLPKKIGRIALCHALNSRGGVFAEFTVLKEGENCYYLVSAGAHERLDHDWLKKMMPQDGSVRYDYLTTQMGVLVLAGPKSRDVLQAITRHDVSNEAFPWLSAQDIDVGFAPSKALRVNFVGELGWELHHPIEYQNHIFDAIMSAGAEHGIKPFGIRAMDMMRIEKSYRMVGTEMSIEYAAFESALERFVRPEKGDFYGRDALLQWQEQGFASRFCTVRVDGIKDADPLGNNPIYFDGELVGRATSGNYGPRLGYSLVLAMVQPHLAEPGKKLKIRILDELYDAEVIIESPFDSNNAHLRA